MTTNNKNKEVAKVKQPRNYTNFKHSIIGLSLLLGVLSIGYSSAYIIMGTNGWTPVVLVAPQIVLGGLIAVWKFCK